MVKAKVEFDTTRGLQWAEKNVVLRDVSPNGCMHKCLLTRSFGDN